MRLGTLISLAGLAMLAAGGAQAQERPKYDELLQAVSQADCDRSEAETFVRFVCFESKAVWYFTKEGMTAHPSYLVWPAWGPSERMPSTNGMFGRGSGMGMTREVARVKAEAFAEWNREIFDVWRRTKPRLAEDNVRSEQERNERLTRRLWPAEYAPPHVKFAQSRFRAGSPQDGKSRDVRSCARRVLSVTLPGY